MTNNRRIFICDNNDFGINEDVVKPVITDKVRFDSTVITFDSTSYTFDNNI